MSNLPDEIRIKTPLKPRLKPGKLAADLLQFAQWADCDEQGKLDQEFLELSRDESTGSQGHFLEALMFFRLATASLLHAEHQAGFSVDMEELNKGSFHYDPDALEEARASLALARKSLKALAKIEKAIADEVPL